MKYFRFTVEGDPVGKQRPRFAGNRTYTPAKTKNYEAVVRDTYLLTSGADFFEKGKPIYVHVDIFIKIPDSASKAMREKMIAKEILPVRKPDCDNVVKTVLDGLEGDAFYNDCQVIAATSRKFYGKKPMITVYLSEEPLCKYFFEEDNK